MGKQIIKQPNGRYCVWSSIAGNVIVYHATRDQIVEEFVRDYRESTEESVDHKLSLLEQGRKPYAQFTIAYEELFEKVRHVHGAEEADELRELIESEPPADESERDLSIPRVWMGVDAMTTWTGPVPEGVCWIWDRNGWRDEKYLTRNKGDIFVAGSQPKPTANPAEMQSLEVCTEIDWHEHTVWNEIECVDFEGELNDDDKAAIEQLVAVAEERPTRVYCGLCPYAQELYGERVWLFCSTKAALERTLDERAADI